VPYYLFFVFLTGYFFCAKNDFGQWPVSLSIYVVSLFLASPVKTNKNVFKTYVSLGDEALFNWLKKRGV